MAQSVATGTIVRCRFVWEWDQRHAYVTRTFRCGPTGAGSSTLEAAYVADAAFAPLLCSVVGPQWNYIGTWCRRLFPAWDESADETVFNGPYSTIPTGDPLPPQVCSLIILRRSGGPSRGIGRMFLPSPTVDESDNGTPTAALLTALDTVGFYMTTTHTAIPPSTGSLFGLTASVGLAIPTSSTLVTAYEVGTKFATQRRRTGASKGNTPSPFDSTGVS